MIAMTRQHTTKPNYLSLSFCFSFSFHCLHRLVRCCFNATRAFSSTSIHRLNNSACIYIHSTCVCIYGCSFELSPFRATYTIHDFQAIRQTLLSYSPFKRAHNNKKKKERNTRTYFTIRTNSISIIIGCKSKTLRREFTRRYSAELTNTFANENT